jgi:hypothetical protein
MHRSQRQARPLFYPLASLSILLATGCASPYYADRGAGLGALGGAGVGAIAGAQSGHPLAGAAIGAGVGAITGGVIGSGMDEIEAKNRAAISAQMGRQIQPGGVGINDVLAMTKSGVDEELIVNHVRANGVAHPLQSGELIALQQEGVSKRVIATMQSAPMPGAVPVGAVQPVPVAPVPMVAYPYPPPPVYWGYYRGPYRPGWGVTFSGR